MSLHDTYGRRINYLRLSVTAQCNLRCGYCMPPGTQSAACHEEALGFEQLHRIAAAAVSLGVEKIRITGGEPLVRPGLIPFLKGLGAIAGLKRLVLTTNGLLLEQLAEKLLNAGVESINISIDSLRPDRFLAITGGGDLTQVLRGLERAAELGFSGIKVNVVVMRGVNDDEVDDFAALTLQRNLKIRFIEYMPIFLDGTEQSRVVHGEELLRRLGASFELVPSGRGAMDGPAAYYRIAGAVGEIGFINPISCHFCHECNRIRVTASGRVKGCLFDDGLYDLKPLLATGTDAEIAAVLRQVACSKPERHRLTDSGAAHTAFAMAHIGG
jgi:cyclic pyranopterin phosphate synthase